MKEKVAKYLSIILGPHVWLPVLIIVILFKTGLNNNQLLILFPSVFILQLIIPISYIYLSLKMKKITAWDLPKREERYKFLAITLASYILSTTLTYIFGNKMLFDLSLIILLLLVMVSVITFFWKISLHTTLNTAGSVLINFLFGWQFPWLYLTIPVIFWARFTLKRHDKLQLIGGILASSIFTLAALKYLGYL